MLERRKKYGEIVQDVHRPDVYPQTRIERGVDKV